MKNYIGTNRIEASPCTLGAYNEIQGWSLPAGQDPSTEGYLVMYPDSKPNNNAYTGYISWSHKAEFEKAYQCEDELLSFPHALELMQQGYRISRKGWTGKNRYAEINMFKSDVHDEPVSALVLVTPNWAPQIGWLPSVEDLLALDWTAEWAYED